MNKKILLTAIIIGIILIITLSLVFTESFTNTQNQSIDLKQPVTGKNLVVDLSESMSIKSIP